MNFSEYFQFLWALLFVIGLIVILALGARRLGFGFPLNTFKHGASKRLSVVEVTSIDARRKLVLVKCDEKEYLLLLGANTETVVDNTINNQFSNAKILQNLLQNHNRPEND